MTIIPSSPFFIFFLFFSFLSLSTLSFFTGSQPPPDSLHPCLLNSRAPASMLVSGLLGARKPPPRQLPRAPPAQAVAGLAIRRAASAAGRAIRRPQLASPAAPASRSSPRPPPRGLRQPAAPSATRLAAAAAP